MKTSIDLRNKKKVNKTKQKRSTKQHFHDVLYESINYQITKCRTMVKQQEQNLEL
jgi:hypothetical protein